MARDQRRLAAIVSADVVGYSRLMGLDESGTLAGLKAHRQELIDSKIAEYGGRIVKTMGDGLLLEFPSVVDAVRCAVDVQRGMAERNAAVPEETRIIFRIGINVGDIIIDGEDIYGDGVNVAARLQTLAEPGGICVSRVVRDQVLDKLNFPFDDLGAQEMKNIARPIEVYRVALEGNSAAGRRQAALRRQAPAKDPPSIAVLPFVNRSHDEEDEYFAEGLADELLNVLTKIRGLRVAARSSAFTFKGKGATVAEVGRALNVATAGRQRAQVRQPAAHLGSAGEGGRRLSPVVGALRPDAGGHLRGAGQHRAVGGTGAARDAAGRGGGCAGGHHGDGTGGGGGERTHRRPGGAPALPASAAFLRSPHPRQRDQGDHISRAGAGLGSGVCARLGGVGPGVRNRSG